MSRVRCKECRQEYELTEYMEKLFQYHDIQPICQVCVNGYKRRLEEIEGEQEVEVCKYYVYCEYDKSMDYFKTEQEAIESFQDAIKTLGAEDAYRVTWGEIRQRGGREYHVERDEDGLKYMSCRPVGIKPRYNDKEPEANE